MCSVPHLTKPVMLLGHGARLGGWDIERLIAWGIPMLTSWQAADLVSNHHELYFGRPGAYGHRAANRILHEADHVISIGCRRSVPCVGHTGIRDNQVLETWDEKTGEPSTTEFVGFEDWIATCKEYREQYPWIEYPTHADTRGYMNSYRVVDALHAYLRPDEVIVTDMGAALVSAFYALQIVPPQRLMTSGGLGEMGCALPAAVGASFARDKGEVLCLTTDGGIMINLQELATIRHHNLPIKIIVFDNRNYSMIIGTQRNFGYAHNGVGPADITLPDFRRLAQAWGIAAADAHTWDELHHLLDQLFKSREPSMVVVHIDPQQVYAPKLQPIMVDGKPTNPRFDQLSPLR